MSILSTLVELAGLALIAYGAYLVAAPLGFVAAGAGTVVVGVALGARR